MTDQRQFETEIEIAAPREEVWNALAQPEIIQRWFAPEAHIDAKVGGELVWRWGDAHNWPQEITVWEPGERLTTRYDSGTKADGSPCPILMDFRLSGEGGHTVLRLVHSGFGPEASFDGEYEGISRGWPVELRSLRLYLEKHRGQERQLTWAHTDLSEPFDRAWQKLTGPEGLGCGASVGSLAEGDPFDFTMSTGERFAGHALICHPHELTGIAHSHGDGFLRVCLEECSGKSQVWLWLATYGQPEVEIARRRREWEALVERLFPAGISSTRGEG